VLAGIVARKETTDTRAWIRSPSENDVEDIREAALTGLVAKGVVAKRDDRFLWVLRSVRYPTIDASVADQVKKSLEDVLSDEIPTPRDLALLSLVDACDILPDLFPDRELKEERAKIAQLRKMDLIGREVAGTIAEIQRDIIQAARAEAARFGKSGWRCPPLPSAQSPPRFWNRACQFPIALATAFCGIPGSTAPGSNGAATYRSGSACWGSRSPLSSRSVP